MFAGDRCDGAGLKVGDRVRYVIDPEAGEKGAQTSAVIPLERDG